VNLIRRLFIELANRIRGVSFRQLKKEIREPFPLDAQCPALYTHPRNEWPMIHLSEITGRRALPASGRLGIEEKISSPSIPY
jgi:hypothetical protein